MFTFILLYVYYLWTNTLFTLHLVPSSAKTASFTILKAQKNTVCNLFRVVAKSGSSVASFSSTSDSSQFILEPVARSFHENPWQQVRGPYTTRVQIDYCNKLQCALTIPIRRTGGSYKYVLMTTGHLLKNVREERARYLSQTTFGPKKSEIDGWDYETGVNGYANHIQAQMELPPTLHREYWRKRMDYGLVMEHPRSTTQVPNHPCNQYSRWRDFAFTTADMRKEFNVTSIQVAGVDMMMISVLDQDTAYYEPRTINATFQAFDVDCLSESEYCGVGEYQTCK